MRRVIAVAVLTVLTGCTRYYYYKDAATYGDFAADHSACVRDIGIQSANREHVLVSPEAYRKCMFTRGWVRAKQTEPVEPGWYRGIERERVVGFDTPPPPPPPTASRPTTDLSEAECRRAVIAGMGNRPEYRGCPR